ncbi:MULTISPECIES: DUF1127 domain-containing protein [Pseudomonas]|uniref:DUF1127 domain-containing protein n=1 Tax=Pseudomonas TaxID=286 RepID=UPI00249CF23C|nr:MULTISPECIES: DUF1127 domain-containing protein [Pseudomonas]
MKKQQKGYALVMRGQLSPASRPPYWRRLLALLARWHRLAAQRRHLASLSDATLKDIGLTRVDVEQEFNRPFWDDQPRG